MPLFSYKVKDARGQIIEDTIQAATVADAATALKSKGLQVLTIRSPQGKFGSLFAKHISTSEKANFSRFLATMIRSGMSLPEGVEIIKRDTKSPKLRKILSDISYQTQKGKSLSAVLSNYKEEFDPIFLTMVKVGEESGTLDKSFDYLSDQLSKSHELSQKVKGSLMYPAVIVLAMIGNGLMMALFVLPRISSVFLKLDLPLPAYTKVILIAGNFFGNNSLLVVITTGLLIFAAFLVVIIKTTRGFILRGLSKLPVAKTVILHVDVARFARTFSTLLKSGVPIINALEVSADSLSRGKLRDVAKTFPERVSRGESLSSVLIASKGVFPGIMVQTVRAGEQSGTLDKVLEELATFYEKEVEFSLKRLTSLIEPVMMLVIGVVVGVMVIMMIAPIYSIIGGLQETIIGG